MNQFDYEALLEETLDSIGHIRQTEFNIILIGPSGAGKSTLSNALVGDGNLLFETRNGNYFPIQQNNFKIQLDLTQSMTKDPQFCIIDQEFSLLDLPGFGDSRSLEIDIRTNLYANALLNSNQKTILLLLIPIKSLQQEKCQKIVEILNMIQDTNIKILLIITKTDKKHKLKDIIYILKECLNNTQTIMEVKSKEILQQIINEQNVFLLKKPQQTSNPNVYQLDTNDITQIIGKVKNKELYKQSKFQMSFSKESKQFLEQHGQKLQKNLQLQEENLINSYVTKKQFCISFLQDESRNLQLEDLERKYMIQFDEFKERILTYNRLANIIQSDQKSYDNYKKSIQKIDELFDYSEEWLFGKELYIRAIQYKASQLLALQQNYFDKNILIETIYIYSQQTFCIDLNIVLPGVNLYIRTQEFSVQSQSQINLKGSKGKPHPKATIENDIIPFSLQGNQGQNGGSLFIDSNIDINLDLLQINLSGGDGGDGQDGADGQNGIDGQDGDYYMVANKDPKCDFHYEEEPFDLVELALTFNRTFKCFYKSPGKSGTQGGYSRQGGIGGNVGLKGINDLKFNQKGIVIDSNSKIGAQGKDGKPGKGGKKGQDYIGIEKQIKIFGRTQDLKNLEKKQDNLVEGALGTVATEVATGVAVASGIAVAKVVIGEATMISAGQAFKCALTGVTGVLSLGIAIGAQIIGTGIQILHSDHKWIEEPHPVKNQEYAESGEVLFNDVALEQIDIDASIQKQKQEFQCRIEKFRSYQVEFSEWIKKEYPIQLYYQLFDRDIETN